ncbi:DUF5658 family protein [Geosporobacter ferrireducens]|uniref:DUF5658 domain-containing protein n=1 Tax=Geosporobacter ferrireducens TaxID=1424294 RepID=A0A1D8GDT8_9FIRM|nr:DUF5658 family protein [Geosporobacter ferrireducens]AOT69075.1 hypothetical protein Gferi_05580 [Geosporobacter ferrireducens]MTI56747.1 hypothetical protein [Geosporobacter ferrireducens]
MRPNNLCQITIIILCLTILDVIFTIYGLQLGMIEEANPILQPMFEKMPLWTGLGIVFFVYIQLWFLYKIRERVRWLFLGLWLLCIVKVSVITLHFNWLFSI